tara:strand:- start:3443 stop:4600 length:1158 start_codon:yes stop_codon:yes gene_type:complete
MKIINIIFFSANRAEYGLIYPFLKIFLKHKMFKVELIIGGSHTIKKFGLSVNEIKNDRIKFSQINLPLKTNTLDNTSNYFNKLQKKINILLEKKKVDLVFLSSDRFETFAFSISAYLKKIPIIHYEGGDITEGGALDDNIRHAITKISNIHLTSNKEAFNRILKMGEEKWRCINVGYSPFHLMYKKYYNLKNVEKKYSLNSNKPLILFTYHPIIKKESDQRKDVDEVFKALKHLSKNYQIIITYPNFDPGYQYILNKILNIKKEIREIKVIKHLGRKNYHSLLYYIGKNKKGFCMGNSSSGIKEAIFFNCPTLNIGDRQKSRLKTKNVLNVKANEIDIINKSRSKSLNYSVNNNPYKLSSNFVSIPDEIYEKFMKSNLMLKKCTI